MFLSNKDKYYEKSSVPFNVRYNKKPSGTQKPNPIATINKTNQKVPKNLNKFFKQKIQKPKIKDKKLKKIIKKHETDYNNIDPDLFSIDETLLNLIMKKINQKDY